MHSKELQTPYKLHVSHMQQLQNKSSFGRHPTKYHSASHFVRKGHMTHISNLHHVTVQRSTALIFLHLPSSVPPFHAQAWRTAQATRTAFLLKHAKGRMSTCTVTRDGRQQCCQPTCEPSLIHSPREDVLRHSRCSGQSKPKFASTETADIWDPSKCFLKV